MLSFCHYPYPQLALRVDRQKCNDMKLKLDNDVAHNIIILIMQQKIDQPKQTHKKYRYLNRMPQRQYNFPQIVQQNRICFFNSFIMTANKMIVFFQIFLLYFFCALQPEAKEIIPAIMGLRGPCQHFLVAASESNILKRFSFYLCFIINIIAKMNIQPTNLSSEQQFQHTELEEMQPDSQEKAQGRWDDDQHQRFLLGLFKFGKNWKQIENLVSTRICSQVRSHAQKYFIKLQKIIKDRKKQKNKLSVEITDIQKEILQRFTLDDVTDKTPEILVSLLQNQCLVPSSKNIEKGKVLTNEENEEAQKGFKRVPKRKISNNQQLNPSRKEKRSEMQEKQEVEGGQKVQSIYDSYCDQDQYQDKSFFCRLMQNNVQHFRQGKDFTDFIDFVGKHHDQTIQSKPWQLESSESTRNRRASFTLVQDQQNDQKRLKEALEKIKFGEKNNEKNQIKR